MTAALARCERLVIGRGGRGLLPPIDCAFEAGRVVAVIGANGSGKSTFVRTLLGLLPAISGRVVLARPELRLSYVPQVKSLDEALPIRAREWVALGQLRGGGFLSPFTARARRAAVEAALHAAGAAELAATPLRELSEGQKQRVLLARLLASEPELAVLDEPTAALDAAAERSAFELLRELARTRGTALAVVTHALDSAAAHADHALLLDREHAVVVSGSMAEVRAHAAFRAHFGEPGSHHG